MNDFLRASASFVVLVYCGALFLFVVGLLLPFTLAWSYDHHILDLTVAGILLPIVAVSYLAYDHAG
ncbi:MULTISPECIES: hypothetical protein [Asaia]|uniref:hypothetical protein n=1 Tax=Asaia TaxID=91914 RepID=UPI002FC39FF3